MLRRTGWRLHVVVTRYLRRTISGGPEEQVRPYLSLSSSSDTSSSEAEDGEESVPQTHQVQVLRAYLRNRRARCVARVREQGLVPAVVVDGDKDRRPKDGSTDVFLSLDAKPLVSILKLMGKRDFLSRVFDMNIYRSSQSSEIQESLQVLPRNLNYGEGKTNILNVQFVRASPSQQIKLGVPLEYLGADQCPGMMKGGTLKKLAKYVVYNCKACEVPAKIVVDMTVLEIGDRVQVQDLEVDFHLLHSDRTMPVCEIVKDVHTLKAKARRLKKEVFYKKKALAESESRTQSRSLSDDEVEVDDEEISATVQRQRRGIAGKDLAVARNSMSGVSGSKRKARAFEQRVSPPSDYETETSDDEAEDEELPAGFRRRREAESRLPVKKSISRVVSIKKGKASEQRICSSSGDEVDVSDEEEDDQQVPARFQRQREAQTVKISNSRVVSLNKRRATEQRQGSFTDDEVDVDDDDDEGDKQGVSTRYQRLNAIQKAVFVKDSLSKVSSSFEKGKASERRPCTLPDDEVDFSDEDEDSFRGVSGSLKKGRASKWRSHSRPDDEVNVSNDEDEAAFAKFQKQRHASEELHSRSSRNKFSGTIKQGRVLEQKVRSRPDREESTGFRRQRSAFKELCGEKKSTSGTVSGSPKKGKPSKRRLLGTPFNVNKETE